MNKLGLALVAVIAAIVVVAPSVFAAQYCVVRNQFGQTGITGGIVQPQYGWHRVLALDCTSTWDAAVRQAGTGSASSLGEDMTRLDPMYHNFPQSEPIANEPFVNMPLP